MELILLERVEGLGNVGDEVTVRAGYGRNFLLPKNKAIVANAGNLKVFERRRKALEEQQRTVFEAAEAEAVKMSSMNLVAVRATSDNKHLYGSIGAAELAAMINAEGFDVARRDILLDEAIKEVGEHEFRVRLHPDVLAAIKITVEAEHS